MPNTFTVMTWNVENLFPPGFKITPTKAVTEDDYDRKLDYLARRITEVGPDVLALQEVGSRNAADTQSVDDLQARLSCGYPHRALSEFPDGRGIRVVLLSKLPLSAIEHIAAFPENELTPVPNWEGRPPIERMGRGALAAVVEPAAGVRVRVVTVHLKSKLISYPASGGGTRFSPRDEDERSRGAALALYRRAVESATVRSYLNAAMAPRDGTHFIVTGDFNDGPRAQTSQMLLGPEDADATTDDKLDWVRLYNLTESVPGRGGAENDRIFLPESERYSRKYLGLRELLDQILASKGLLGESARMRKGEWKVQEVRSLVDSIEKESVTDSPGERAGALRPDHAPVYARFAL
jgi:endonuclease/exonuclease/phosphatase family metal-dependent hydrolase